MSPLTDLSTPTLQRFAEENVQPGSTAITDRWTGYLGLNELAFRFNRRTDP